MRRLGWLTVLFGACSGTPAPSATPPAIAPEAPVTRVDGRIEAIRMDNVNKARGHYTYNVALMVRVDVVEPPPDGWTPRGERPLAVRVDKVSWGALSKAERASVAPAGPAQVLSPPRWHDWQVGDEVHLRVRFTSPDLAHLEPGP